MLLSPSDYDGQLCAAASLVSSVVSSVFPSPLHCPCVAVVLGSGLSDLASHLVDVHRLSYSEIPHMPVPAVSGHQGELIIGRIEPPPSSTTAPITTTPSLQSTTQSKPPSAPSAAVPLILCFSGRVHSYEGHLSSSLCFITRLCAALKVQCMVYTNSAGGAGAGMREGSVMLITDHLRACHINSPMDCVRDGEGRLGEGSVDGSTSPLVYCESLQGLVRSSAVSCGVELHEGAYHWSCGPTYETHAEVRAGMALGVAAFGMSTVPEVLAAAALQMPSIALSLCTNLAAGLTSEVLTHEGVKEVANLAGPRFRALVHHLLHSLSLHFTDTKPLTSPLQTTTTLPLSTSTFAGVVHLDLHERVGWVPSLSEVEAAAALLAKANAPFPPPLFAVVMVGGDLTGKEEWGGPSDLHLLDVRTVPLSTFPALSSPPLSRSAVTASLTLTTWDGGGGGGGGRCCVLSGVQGEGFTASESSFLMQLLARVGVKALVYVGSAMRSPVHSSTSSTSPSVLLLEDFLDRTMEPWPPLCLLSTSTAAASSLRERSSSPLFDCSLSSVLRSSSAVLEAVGVGGGRCVGGSVAFFAGPSWPGQLERSMASALSGCAAIAVTSPSLPVYASAVGMATSAVFVLHDSATKGNYTGRPLLRAILPLLAVFSASATSPALSLSSPSPPSLRSLPRRPHPYGPTQERWEMTVEGGQRWKSAMASLAPSLPSPPSPPHSLVVLHPAVYRNPPTDLFTSLYSAPAMAGHSPPSQGGGEGGEGGGGWTLHIGRWKGRLTFCCCWSPSSTEESSVPSVEWGSGLDCLTSLVPLLRMLGGTVGVKALVVIGCPVTSLDSTTAPIGSFHFVSDHVNLTGFSPLFGHNEDRYGPRFPDCSHMYDTTRGTGGGGGEGKEAVGAVGEGIVVAGLRGLFHAKLPSLRRWLRAQGIAAIAPAGLLHLSIVSRHMGMTCTAVVRVDYAMEEEGRDKHNAKGEVNGQEIAQWLPPPLHPSPPTSFLSWLEVQ